MTNSGGGGREGEDPLVLILEIHYKGQDETVLVPYGQLGELQVQDILDALVDVFGLSEPERLGSWLVFKGRKLLLHEHVQPLGIENYSKLYLGVTARGGGSLQPASPPSSSSTEGITSGVRGADGGAAQSAALGGFVDILASDPELMLELMRSNPRMKSLLDRNPQLRHALSDPSTLKELLGASSRSPAFQEAMRGHDRALANIENLPGGFQALQQFYTKELAEVEQSIDELRLPRGREDLQSVPKQQLTTDPMPNPWSRPSAKAAAPFLPSASSSLWRRPPPPPTAAQETFDEARLGEYEARFAGQLQVMQDMGFDDRRDNIKALLATGGNVSLAIEWVISRRGSHLQ